VAAAAGVTVPAAAATAAHPASAIRARLARSREDLWCREFPLLPAVAIISLSPITIICAGQSAVLAFKKKYAPAEPTINRRIIRPIRRRAGQGRR
jgi:hypothetical protein